MRTSEISRENFRVKNQQGSEGPNGFEVVLSLSLSSKFPPWALCFSFPFFLSKKSTCLGGEGMVIDFLFEEGRTFERGRVKEKGTWKRGGEFVFSVIKGRRRLWVKDKRRRLWIKNDEVWLKRNVIKSWASQHFYSICAVVGMWLNLSLIIFL
jgi:hypothetical protein